MGLDSYLFKKTYVKNWDHNGPEERIDITIKKGGKDHPSIKVNRISEIVEEVAYWRKFNALHQWFVDKTQDGHDACQESYVSRENLRELTDILKEVIKSKPDENGNRPDDAPDPEDILPTQSGFFFGGTEYDDWYYMKVQQTIEVFEELLKEDDDGEFYYRASW